MEKISIFLMDLSGGGAEKAMLYLANEISQRGYSVDLVLVKAEGPYLEEILTSVNVVELQAPRLLLSLSRLTNYLKSERPSVLMTTLGDTNFVALWARRFANVPTRIVLSIQTHMSLGAKRTTRLKHKLTPFLASLFYPWADEIISTSQGVAEDLASIVKMPVEDVKVIYNPIITADFFEKVAQPVDHPWFSQEQKSQHPVIIGVGRLELQKDFHSLIHALAKVRERYPARLMILGEGSLRASLEELIQTLRLSECVALPGFVDNPYAYMAQASIFVLSSLFEGFGNVLGEAMAAGTPVVSTDCQSGPSEILEGGAFGKLVAVGDTDAMSEAILQTLECPPDIESIRLRGHHFSVDRATSEYLKVLVPEEKDVVI